jgi:hypothetical protein
MSLLDGSHSSNTQTSLEYWQDELKNSRVLLFNIDEAIKVISTSNHQSYTLDTGQSSQTVTRVNLPSLISQREILINRISQLEKYLGEGKPSVIQTRPGW